MNENKTENKPCRNCVHRPVDNRKPYGWECSECCHFYGSKFEKRAEGENEKRRA